MDAGFLPVLLGQSTKKSADARHQAAADIGLSQKAKRSSNASPLLFDEGSLDDVMARCRVIAFGEAALVENGTQILEH